MVDWKKVREEFPVCKKYVYLNPAGGSPVSRSAAVEGKRFYDEMLEFGDTYWDRWLERTENVRNTLAVGEAILPPYPIPIPGAKMRNNPRSAVFSVNGLFRFRSFSSSVIVALARDPSGPVKLISTRIPLLIVPQRSARC